MPYPVSNWYSCGYRVGTRLIASCVVGRGRAAFICRSFARNGNISTTINLQTLCLDRLGLDK
jgi:hypothetical protein